jgi:acyl-CoA reductase-like NAD-dependent aldehyde dehydrogenase
MSNICIIRNPFTGNEVGRTPFDPAANISAALTQAVKIFPKWRSSTAHVRSQTLLAVASRLEARRQEFATLIRDEAGKPIAASEAEVLRAIAVLRWAAGEALRFSGEMIRLDTVGSGRPGYGMVTRFARGPILGITPFNFPLNLLVHKVAPAIASGCPILIKPSPFTPLTAQRFASIFHEIGAPEGLVEVVMADDDATALLTRAPEIAMVSFTGSARVGKLVQAQAAPTKPVTLELGGNAWVAVLEDVPESAYPAIARKIANGAFGYAGQSCISVQNVSVPESIAVAFEAALKKATEETLYGNPADPNVVSGPVINDAAAVRINEELAKAAQNGEITQSKKISGINEAQAPAKGVPSRLIPPTLVCLTEQFLDSSIVQEEIFGPVMTLSSFPNSDFVGQFIQQVNSSRYGLQSGVFTQRWDAIEQMYRELNVGGLVVNDVPTSRYDHQPYGGEKDSGHGREGLRYAMEEMTSAKFLGLSSQLPS